MVLYEDLDHTKIFANDLKLVECSLRYILEEVIPYREKLIKPYRKKAILDNMDEYNKLKKCINEQPMILLVFDETSSIYQTKGCSKEDVKLKDEIKGHINGLYTIVTKTIKYSIAKTKYYKSFSGNIFNEKKSLKDHYKAVAFARVNGGNKYVKIVGYGVEENG